MKWYKKICVSAMAVFMLAASCPFPSAAKTQSSPQDQSSRSLIYSATTDLQNSLNRLERSYGILLGNPNSTNRRRFNDAVGDAKVKSTRLAKLSRKFQQQLAQNPQQPSARSDGARSGQKENYGQLGKTPGRPPTRSDDTVGGSKDRVQQLQYPPVRPSTGAPGGQRGNKQRGASISDYGAFKGNVPIRQEDETGDEGDHTPPAPPPDPHPKPDPPKGESLPPSQTWPKVVSPLQSTANSLLSDLSAIQRVTRKQTTLDASAMSIIQNSMNAVIRKNRNLNRLQNW